MTAQTEPQAYYRDPETRAQVKQTIGAYLGFYSDGPEAKRMRHEQYATMVNQYYDLVTDFYERGWGQSFHFAPRFEGESFAASLARHEHFLALELGLRPGHKVLDVGCGVGGPMRAIARFSGASVDGVNNNDYQLTKLTRYNEAAGLANLCRGFKGDFMSLDVKDGTYDAAYAVEATCHAPDKVGVFSEIFRTLKPGGHFAAYEWCLTDRYDANDARHREIKRDIETGDSLPDIATMPDVVDALSAAGFEVLASEDVAKRSSPSTPWYQPLKGDRLSATGLRRSIPGRFVSNRMVWLLETLKIAPQGSGTVSDMLNLGADALIAGGEAEIFTPCFFVLARKPKK
jgi:sterol 24-C-methyltransferase